MKKLVLIAALVVFAQGASAQDKKEARVWADQVVCQADYTYFDYTTADVIQRANATVFYNLKGKGDAVVRKLLKLDKVGLIVEAAVNFDNRDKNGIPEEEKSLYLAAKLIDNKKITSSFTLFDKVSHLKDQIAVGVNVKNPVVENVKWKKGEHLNVSIKKAYPDVQTILWDLDLRCDATSFERQQPGTDF